MKYLFVLLALFIKTESFSQIQRLTPATALGVTHVDTTRKPYATSIARSADVHRDVSLFAQKDTTINIRIERSQLDSFIAKKIDIGQKASLLLSNYDFTKPTQDNSRRVQRIKMLSNNSVHILYNDGTSQIRTYQTMSMEGAADDPGSNVDISYPQAPQQNSTLSKYTTKLNNELQDPLRKLLSPSDWDDLVKAEKDISIFERIDKRLQFLIFLTTK
ncbi:hypothetical protein SAMN05444410_1037 [Hydrobacter penzbergensis]|uniref:Uncharacterized protein n=1 Tax=Hydrobacter penzbergensis TaxID=1235997 RepID=A0A8X8IFG7_9BACT|nr:hypothetical protein [Hydrobacter penzbergensis]SDW45829.1 hypothetical protein SAMN05444410_1037 [Hydrobacter penzbergensis]